MQFANRWATFLFAMLCVVIFINTRLSDYFLGINNIANIFHLSIEKALLVLMMAFIIINGEIDLSVGSIMGISAAVLAERYQAGWSVESGIVLALLVGTVCGMVNGLFVAYMGIPSLIVTLAGLIGYRGIARILLEDRSVGGFPNWFTDFAQNGFIGPFPLTVFLFLALFLLAYAVLSYTVFGRYVYVIGNNREAAEYAGINAKQVKVLLFALSGFMAALAGVLYVARLGNIRANAAEGFELDVITIVLLGGVSIFGGVGTMLGVGLSLVLVLCLRNGMSLANVNGNTQTSVIGALLILSVLIPNWTQQLQAWLSQRALHQPDSSKGGGLEHKASIGTPSEQ